MKFAILAAGEGSRLSHEGIALPKPLVTLNGEPMIDRLVRVFRRCGAEAIYIITNNLTPLTRQHLERLQQAGAPLHIVVKTTPSSMHSFYELMPYIGQGKFCLTTVDTVFREQEFETYIEAFKQKDVDALMAVTDFVDDEKPLYLSTTADLSVTGFHDSKADFAASEAAKSGQAECRYISGGIYCLTDKVFPVLQQCIDSGQSRMRNFQRALCLNGLRVEAWPFTKIVDVDHAADIALAEAFLSETK